MTGRVCLKSIKNFNYIRDNSIKKTLGLLAPELQIKKSTITINYKTANVI